MVFFSEIFIDFLLSIDNNAPAMVALLHSSDGTNLVTKVSRRTKALWLVA